MAYPSWRPAAELLAADLRPAAGALLTLAEAVGVDVRHGDSRLVVAARVDDYVSAVTRRTPPRRCTAPQRALLESLGIAPATSVTTREADAFIREAISEQRLVALRAVRPERGDRLVRTVDGARNRTGEIVEVSSVDRLGHVWVKGAAGYPTRPQDLRRLK